MYFKPIVIAIGLAFAIGPALSNAQGLVDATTTLPPNAKAGECWVKAIIPAEYKTESVEVVERQASEKIEVIPAAYKTIEEKVLVKEASFTLVPVAAVYTDATEKVEVRPGHNMWVDARGKKANEVTVAAAGSLGADLAKASPGMCYLEHLLPAKTRVEAVKVLVKAESQKIEVIPATYETIEERVLVKEATQKVTQVPAVYDTVTEKVLVEPAQTIWKKGRGPIQKVDDTTGEIMCLVEVPAKYEFVESRVVKAPASIVTEQIPAEYAFQKVQKLVSPATEKRTTIAAEYTEVGRVVPVSNAQVKWYPKDSGSALGEATGRSICMKAVEPEFKTVRQRVIKTPASFTKEEVPAKFKVVEIQKLVAGPKENRTAIPATSQTVTKRLKVSDERLEWRTVLCETNTTPDLVTKIQASLKAAGFDPGPVDGSLGGGTLRAAEEYQKSKGLSRGGLTMETVSSLGVL